MNATKTHAGGWRSALIIGAVVAISAVGVVLVRSNSSDSDRDRNIAGGSDVAISAVPYQVALVSYSLDANGVRDRGGKACGGAIISAKWVLTADHCIWRDSAGRIYPEHVDVGNGGSEFWPSIGSSTVRRATRLLPARGVAGAWPNADLLLIEVDKPFDFSSSVRAAALPIGLDNATWPAVGATGLITGWGITLNSPNGQESLRGVTMKVNAASASAYCLDDRNPAYYYYSQTPFVAARHLCLLRPTPDIMASACSGDSGGPFAMTVGDRTVLAGVASKAAREPNASFSFDSGVCTGTTPNLYERVAASLDWMVPGAVVGLAASTNDGVVTVQWQAPERTPAAAINDYIIEYRQVGATDWLVLNDGKSTTTSASLNFDLPNGIVLEFRVSGINAVNEIDASMRQFATLNYVVGSVATTTTTSTTTSTTSTTLPPYTTTIAPSTTARQLQVGPKATTTVLPAVTTTVPAAPPTASPATAAPQVPPTAAPQTTVAMAKPAVAPSARVEGEDPGFSQPKVTVPAGSGLEKAPPATSPPVAAKPAPAVGVSLTALQIAEITGNSVLTGQSVTVSVAKGSAKVCRASGAGISFLAKGKCKATLRVGAKPSSAKKKNVTLTVP